MNTKLTNGFFDGALARIQALQQRNGAIGWFEDGIIDPWNHLEAVMGLNLCGAEAATKNGFQFLQDSQLADGSWWAQLGSLIPLAEETQNFTTKNMADKNPIRETNFCAYIATALWHDYLLRGDKDFSETFWPVMAHAINFTLRHQTEYGDICWIAPAPLGTMPTADWFAQTDSLLAGNSSIYRSLSCALQLATLLNRPQPAWQTAKDKLQKALTTTPHRFDRLWESKTHFSMDWFYPILSGALSPQNSRARLHKRWDEFVVEGVGCRCVSDKPWITAAETAELCLTLNLLGEKKQAREMLGWLTKFRDTDGAYWMGYHYEQNVFWPNEKPAWTAGAIILATDAVEELSPAHKLFHL